eukprot:GHVL01033085.1.p1 GENE.GHVL01033085.1~~GHVL01033085.1.p1  ORF type:complete len:123 (+),score=26.05 GHVL01033085.1:146-514(+)
MSSYDNIVRGGLSLKKGRIPTKHGKKRKKIETNDTNNEAVEDSAKVSKTLNSDEAETDEISDNTNTTSHMTPSEKAFKVAQDKRSGVRASLRADMTHRQRMEKFNQHLATLSNHFDLPKVGG